MMSFSLLCNLSSFPSLVKNKFRNYYSHFMERIPLLRIFGIEGINIYRNCTRRWFVFFLKLVRHIISSNVKTFHKTFRFRPVWKFDRERISDPDMLKILLVKKTFDRCGMLFVNRHNFFRLKIYFLFLPVNSCNDPFHRSFEEPWLAKIFIAVNVI